MHLLIGGLTAGYSAVCVCGGGAGLNCWFPTPHTTILQQSREPTINSGTESGQPPKSDSEIRAGLTQANSSHCLLLIIRV